MFEVLQTKPRSAVTTREQVSSTRLHVGFYLDRFPVRSETFIRNQITGLIDLGHHVTIYADRCDELGVWELDDVRKYSLDGLIKPKKIEVPRKRYTRILKALTIVSRNWVTNKKQIIECLNLRKHGRKALNLELLFSAAPYFGRPIDVLQCHFGHIAEGAVFLKRLGFVFRMQVMFHCHDIRMGLEKGGQIYKGLQANVDRVQAISKLSYHHLVEFGFSPGKIVMHPVGIDLEKFSKKKHYSSQGAVRILSVGRLASEKGHIHAIRAIAKVIREAGCPIEYRIVGSGYMRAALEEEASRLGMIEKVIFLGPKDSNDVRDELRAADLYLLPSEAEMLPVSLMEAIASGLPAVVTEVGAVRELLHDGLNGVLAKSRDPDSLAESLLRIIGERRRWAEMGSYGRSLVEEFYDIRMLNKRLINDL